MTIDEFEKLIDAHFGLTVQVVNECDTYCVNNKYTLGQASLKEDLKDWCKDRCHNSIEDWLKSENCKTLEEYYSKKLSMPLNQSQRNEIASYKIQIESSRKNLQTYKRLAIL